LESFTPLPLYPQGKSLRYPSDGKLGGAQSWTGRSGKDRNSLSLPGVELRLCLFFYMDQNFGRYGRNKYKELESVDMPFLKAVVGCRMTDDEGITEELGLTD